MNTGLNVGIDGSAAKSGARVVKRAMNDIKESSKDATSNVDVLKVSLVNFMSTALKTAAAIVGINTAVYAMKEAFRFAFQSVDSFKTNVASLSAVVMTFMDKTGKDLAQSWKQANEYARNLIPTLELISAKMLMTGQQATYMFTELAKGGNFLDVTNKKAVEGFQAIGNAIMILTRGQDPERQIMTEIRAVMTGQAQAGSMLMRMLEAIDPKLKAHLRMWRDEGIAIEKLGELLEGFAQATKDLSGLWRAVSTTISTLVTQSLRGGLITAYNDIMGQMMKIRDYLTEHRQIIGDKISVAYETIKSTVSFIADKLGSILSLVISLRKEIETIVITFAAIKLYGLISASSAITGLFWAAKNLGFMLQYLAISVLPALSSPLGLAAIAIGALTYAFLSMESSADRAKKKLDEYITSIKFMDISKAYDELNSLNKKILETAEKWDKFNIERPSGLIPKMFRSSNLKNVENELNDLLTMKKAVIDRINEINGAMNTIKPPKAEKLPQESAEIRALNEWRRVYQDISFIGGDTPEVVKVEQIFTNLFTKLDQWKLRLKDLGLLSEDILNQLKRAGEHLADTWPVELNIAKVDFKQLSKDITHFSSVIGNIQFPVKDWGRAYNEIKNVVESGQNDILKIFAKYPNMSEAQMRVLETEFRKLSTDGVQALNEYADAFAKIQKARADLINSVEERRISLLPEGLEKDLASISNEFDKTLQAYLEKWQSEGLLKIFDVGIQETPFDISVKRFGAGVNTFEESVMLLEKITHDFLEGINAELALSKTDEVTGGLPVYRGDEEKRWNAVDWLRSSYELMIQKQSILPTLEFPIKGDKSTVIEKNENVQEPSIPGYDNTDKWYHMYHPSNVIEGWKQMLSEDNLDDLVNDVKSAVKGGFDSYLGLMYQSPKDWSNTGKTIDQFMRMSFPLLYPSEIKTLAEDPKEMRKRMVESTFDLIAPAMYVGPKFIGFENLLNKFSNPVDRMARGEISDAAAEIFFNKFKDIGSGYGDRAVTGRLGQLYKHPALYAGYPDLSKIETKLALDPLLRGAEGETMNARGVIKGSQIMLAAPDTLSLLESLTHEVQHVVQAYEKFAPGGMPELFSFMDSPRGFIQARDMLTQMGHGEYLGFGLPGGSEAYFSKPVLRQMFDIANNLPPGEEISFGLYRRLLGEIESRDSGFRRIISPEGRMSIMPLSSQGIPQKEWIDISYMVDGLSEKLISRLRGNEGLSILRPTGEITLRPSKEWTSGLYVGKSAIGFEDLPGKFGNVVDKQVRAEIDDSMSSFIPTVKEYFDMFANSKNIPQLWGKLGKYFEFPKLYELYPEIPEANLKLALDKSLRPGYGQGQVDFIRPENDIWGLASGYQIHASGNEVRDIQATLIHEIQHIIQNIERWAPGSGPEAFRFMERPQELERIDRFLRTTGDPSPEFMLAFRSVMRESNTPLDRDTAKKILQIVEDFNKSWVSKLPDMQTELPYSAYRSVAGEIEARDAAARWRFRTAHPGAQPSLPPYASQEISPSKWLDLSYWEYGPPPSGSVWRSASRPGPKFDLPSLTSDQGLYHSNLLHAIWMRDYEKMAEIVGRKSPESIYDKLEIINAINKKVYGITEGHPFKVGGKLSNKLGLAIPGIVVGAEVASDQDLIDRLSGKYSVDPSVVRSMIKQESNFNSLAVSKKGATGLMQLMPGTFYDMKVGGDITDSAQNLEAGIKYFSQMMEKFKDVTLALAAYNAGPGNVEKYGGVPPFKETQDYVRNVLKEVTSSGITLMPPQISREPHLKFGEPIAEHLKPARLPDLDNIDELNVLMNLMRSGGDDVSAMRGLLATNDDVDNMNKIIRYLHEEERIKRNLATQLSPLRQEQEILSLDRDRLNILIQSNQLVGNWNESESIKLRLLEKEGDLAKNSLQQQLAEAQSNLDSIKTRVKIGLAHQSDIEFYEKKVDLLRDEINETEKLYRILEQNQDLMTTGWGSFKAGIRDALVEMGKLNEQIRDIGYTSMSSFQKTLSGIISGRLTKSEDMIKSFTDPIRDALADMVSSQITHGIFSIIPGMGTLIDPSKKGMKSDESWRTSQEFADKVSEIWYGSAKDSSKSLDELTKSATKSSRGLYGFSSFLSGIFGGGGGSSYNDLGGFFSIIPAIFGGIGGDGGSSATTTSIPSSGHIRPDYLPVRVHSGGHIRKYHLGGIGNDEILSILQDNEYVISRRGVDAYGVANLDRINQGLPMRDIPYVSNHTTNHESGDVNIQMNFRGKDEKWARNMKREIENLVNRRIKESI